MADTTIPTDEFSRLLRETQNNPGAFGAGSTVHIKDFYGNLESWIVETYRVNGTERVFIQRTTAAGLTRLVLPEQITATYNRHRDQLIARSRRRAARQAVATRRSRGDVLGNPEALKVARRKRKGRRP